MALFLRAHALYQFNQFAVEPAGCVTTNTILGNGSTITLNNVFSNLAGTTYPTVAGVPQNWKAGRVQEFSIGIQHEFWRGFMLDVGYVRNPGGNLYGTLNINFSHRPGRGGTNAASVSRIRECQHDPECVFVTLRRSGDSHGEAPFGGNAVSCILYPRQILRQFVGFGRHPTHRSTAAISRITGGCRLTIYEIVLYSATFMSCRSERRRKFLTNMKGVSDALLGGWKLNGVVTSQTGQPLTPVLATDNSNTGQLADWPNVVGNPLAILGDLCQVHTAACWLNPAAFAAAPKYTFGNVQRNSLEGPGLQEWDFSMLKDFRFNETRRLEFRAEAFNVLNHVNYDNPTITVGPSFGRILTAEPSRQMQFGLRFVF